MLVQTRRRSFVAGIAATAAAGTLLPVATIARDSGGASEELAYPHTPCRFRGCPVRGGTRPGMTIKLSLNHLNESEH